MKSLSLKHPGDGVLRCFCDAVNDGRAASGTPIDRWSSRIARREARGSVWWPISVISRPASRMGGRSSVRICTGKTRQPSQSGHCSIHRVPELPMARNRPRFASRTSGSSGFGISASLVGLGAVANARPRWAAGKASSARPGGCAVGHRSRDPGDRPVLRTVERTAHRTEVILPESARGSARRGSREGTYR